VDLGRECVLWQVAVDARADIKPSGATGTRTAGPGSLGAGSKRVAFAVAAVPTGLREVLLNENLRSLCPGAKDIDGATIWVGEGAPIVEQCGPAEVGLGPPRFATRVRQPREQCVGNAGREFWSSRITLTRMLHEGNIGVRGLWE